MSRRPPHLLRVEEGPQSFAVLIAAAAAAGLRVGWLELAAPESIAPGLEAAAAAGAQRAVAAGGSRSVAVKPLRGAPVLRDLLREHFAGCALVLVRGEITAPVLAATAEGWEVRSESARLATLADLIDRLRRPRLF